MNECFNKIQNNKVYAVVDVNPVITAYNEEAFLNYLNRIIDDLVLDPNFTSIVKIRIFFPLEGDICVLQVGTKGDKLDATQLAIINNRISRLGTYKFGRQGPSNVNCKGILYISIIDGKITDVNAINFETR